MELVPALQKELASMSEAPPEQAFRSVTADMFGYFIKTKMVSRQIVAAIQSPRQLSPRDYFTILEGKDKLFVMEVGADFMGTEGFTRATTWLQRH